MQAIDQRMVHMYRTMHAAPPSFFHDFAKGILWDRVTRRKVTGMTHRTKINPWQCREMQKLIGIGLKAK